MPRPALPLAVRALVALLVLAAPRLGRAADAPVLAVLPVTASVGVTHPEAVVLTDPLVQELRDSGAFSRVVTPAEIAALMPLEQQSILLKCAQDECTLVDTELAGALGASHLLVANLSRVGDSLLFNARILELRSSLVVASVSERVRASTSEVVLDRLRPVTLKLLRSGGFNVVERTPPPAPEESHPPILQGGGAVLALGAVPLVVTSGAALAGALGWLVAVYRVGAFVHALPPLASDSPGEFLVKRHGGAIALTTGASLLAALAAASLVAGAVLVVVGWLR